MKRIATLLVVLVSVAAFGGWWFSDTQVLKRKAETLMKVLTFDAGTGKAARQMGAYSLHTLLAPRIELNAAEIREANGTFDRDEFESFYTWWCNAAKRTDFKVLHIDSVTVNGSSAIMKLHLLATVELPTYKLADGEQEVTFSWQKFKDGWRLEKAVWNQKSKTHF